MVAYTKGQILNTRLYRTVKDGHLADLGGTQNGYLHVSQLNGKHDAAKQRFEQLAGQIAAVRQLAETELKDKLRSEIEGEVRRELSGNSAADGAPAPALDEALVTRRVDERLKKRLIEAVDARAKLEGPEVRVMVTEVAEPVKAGDNPRIRLSEFAVRRAEQEARREARTRQLDELKAQLQAGEHPVVTGTIKKMFQWGAIVTLEGGLLDGKLHGTELVGVGGVDRPARNRRQAQLREPILDEETGDVVVPGTSLTVEVVKIERNEDPDAGHVGESISLSEKAIADRSKNERYVPGFATSGTYVGMSELGGERTGLRLDLGNGVEGILLATPEHLAGAAIGSMTKRGQSVKVRVLEVKDGTIYLTRKK